MDVHNHTVSKSNGNKLALFALAVTFFGVGVTEFISVGVLPAVSEEFGITTSMAGLIVSMYALGVAIGGPVLTSLTAKFPRKNILLAVIVLFIIGHVITAIAPVFSIVLAGRILSAFAHGVFFAIGSNVAASLVPKTRQASAIAFVFGGFTIATAIGAPLGTYISEMFGWRLPFFGIAIIGVIALIFNFIGIPGQQLKTETPPSFKEQLKLVSNGRILLVLSVTILGYGGTFVTFTYLSPILQEVMGISPKYISVILFMG